MARYSEFTNANAGAIAASNCSYGELSVYIGSPNNPPYGLQRLFAAHR